LIVQYIYNSLDCAQFLFLLYASLHYIMGATLKLVMLLVVKTFVGTPAQRYLDPWGSTFDDSFGFFNQDLPPCPEYQPMWASKWEKIPSGHFLLRGTLPGVQSNTRRVWLDPSGTTLHIQAARPVPARGRRCLPSSARISSDGRFEVYAASVALPRTANAAGGTIQQIPNGIEVLLPVIPTAISGAKHRSSAMANVAHNARLNPAREVRRWEKQLRSPSVGTVTEESSKTRVSLTPMPKSLPEIPEGVEVFDIEPEELLKDPDAANGWYDNRGEFQEY